MAEIVDYKIICDVCNEKADGSWNSDEYLNGEVQAEYYCIADLCQEHIEIFANEFNERRYMEERYEHIDKEEKNKRIEELVVKIKEYEEEEV